MMIAHIHLDESGDLGWKFGSPYRKGGSSRYLTISALLTRAEDKYKPKRLIKSLYERYKWPVSSERKWFDMNAAEKLRFVEDTLALLQNNPEIICTSITVYKPRVFPHIRNDGNKLYNYMIGLMLLDKMVNFDQVIFRPDPRSIKVQSGSNLPDYLQTQLWFEHNAKTELIYQLSDSKANKCIQFVDMLAGVVQQNYEDNNSDLFDKLKPYIDHRKLYFPDNHN